MNTDGSARARSRSGDRRGRRLAIAAAILVPLVLAAAGCGGGPKSPGVASLGTTATSTAPSQPSSSGGANPSNPTAFVAFVDCMQKHGVQAQLGQGGHGVSITGGPGPNAPQMQAAQKACQRLLPGGGPKPLSPAQQVEENKELLALATCMRTHGYPNFPDPSSQGSFDITGSNGFDPNSTQFQTAMSSCQPHNGAVPLRIRIQSFAGAGPPASK